MASRFVREMDMLEGDRGVREAAEAQFDVFKEEVDELEDAFESGDLEAIAEEQADVQVTVRVLCAILGINSDKAYRAKMEYNLSKHGNRNDDGKIVDDSNVEKPDFSWYTPRWSEW